MSQLQQFRSHKVVEAMKIASISPPPTGAKRTILAGELGSEIIVEPEYVEKHKPQVGGYYVRYADGYESWSPAEAFEQGYAPLAPEVPQTSEPETRYPVKDEMVRRFDEAFTYHPPKGDQPKRYQMLREMAKGYAVQFVLLTPPGREQALALTKLEELVFWANASIARGEK